MNRNEIRNAVLELKKQLDVCIIAHSYQTAEVTALADYVGDSYGLAVKAAKTNASTILMCGVRFMAETAKILSPEKKVIIANGDAGCPMAEQLSVDDVLALKKKYPGYAVACYVNTTAALKTVCDVCVTSSSAVKVLERYESDNFIFIPDRNLGEYVRGKLPHKNFVLVNGCCPVHASVTEDEIVSAIEAHPGCPLLVHPECIPDVLKHADYVGSTAGIMDYARKSDGKKFIIGTETEIANHLKDEMPDKEFYCASTRLLCKDMKLTTSADILNALNGVGGAVIDLEPETALAARKCIDEMIRLGG